MTWYDVALFETLHKGITAVVASGIAATVFSNVIFRLKHVPTD